MAADLRVPANDCVHPDRRIGQEEHTLDGKERSAAKSNCHRSAERKTDSGRRDLERVFRSDSSNELCAIDDYARWAKDCSTRTPEEPGVTRVQRVESPESLLGPCESQVSETQALLNEVECAR